MINDCRDAFLLLQRLRAWVRVRSRARSLRCTGVLASAGAGWAALSSGSTRSKTVRHPTAFAPPNRRDYQIGSRGGFARLTLGRCATTVGFGYAVTGASAGLSGDEDRVGRAEARAAIAHAATMMASNYVHIKESIFTTPLEPRPSRPALR